MTLDAVRARWARFSLAALAAILSALPSGTSLLAQERPGDNPPFETIQIRPNVHVIFGAGGNITAHVGEDGVILVDAGVGPAADKVVAAVKAITSAPIRLVINTSADLDHVGGNEALAKAGTSVNPDGFSDEERATVLAQENVLLRMSGNEATFPWGLWPT
jgi:glyoxylase-like metal-dependent hydrolase (beta-lactamase superfamily II)